MSLTSTYTFDHQNLWGNFTYKNVAEYVEQYYPSTSHNMGSMSVLIQPRPDNELLINLYSAFNTAAFLALIDVGPLIDGESITENPNALMYTIIRPMNHYGYRSSDVRAGWIEWRDVPFHNDEPSLFQDGDLLNQVALNFHINRGEGTVDNDGWITYYYKFSLDAQGRLTASVEGWAYQFGGGTGLNDGGEDLGATLKKALPAFVGTLQSFLDRFCSNAGLFENGVQRDSNGRALFDHFYLLPGNGNMNTGAPQPTGIPLPGIGPGDMPVDTEVTLVLLSKVKQIQQTPSVPRSYEGELKHFLKGKGFDVKTVGIQETDEQKIEISIQLNKSLKKESGASATKHNHKPNT